MKIQDDMNKKMTKTELEDMNKVLKNKFIIVKLTVTKDNVRKKLEQFEESTDKVWSKDDQGLHIYDYRLLNLMQGGTDPYDENASQIEEAMKKQHKEYSFFVRGKSCDHTLTYNVDKGDGSALEYVSTSSFPLRKPTVRDVNETLYVKIPCTSSNVSLFLMKLENFVKNKTGFVNFNPLKGAQARRAERNVPKELKILKSLIDQIFSSVITSLI